MTRPKKNNVDYFPHYCKHGKVLFVLESKYGNDGYAFFYKLLEILGDTEGLMVDCSKPSQLEYLTAVSGAKTPQSVTDMLGTLSNMEIIDPKLWSNGIIWMQSFVDSVSDVFRKRCQSVPEKPISVPETPITGTDIPQKPSDNPQSKVKESKVNKKKSVVLSDEEWLKTLEDNPTYEGIEVRVLYGKMAVWCENKKKKPTRTRFINWLNREEKPLHQPKEEAHKYVTI